MQHSSLDGKKSKSLQSSFSTGAGLKDPARRQSAAAGDGQFEVLLNMKLVSVVSQRELESSPSSSEQAYYRHKMQKSQASLALLAHCNRERSQALALLGVTDSAVSAKKSNDLSKAKK